MVPSALSRNNTQRYCKSSYVKKNNTLKNPESIYGHMARSRTHLRYSAKSPLPTDLPNPIIRFNKRARGRILADKRNTKTFIIAK
jgi:hypothetical protein